MMISVFEKQKSIVGKGENAAYLHFLLFTQSFKIMSVSDSLKLKIVWYTQA